MRILSALAGTAALFAVVLAATTVLASEANRVRRGTPYNDARKALLAGGFLPARIGACSAPGREEICTGFSETQMCAGTGFAECEFAFRRPDGATVLIVTRGEKLEALTVYRVKRSRSLGARQQEKSHVR
jgi:hypothetical protein